MSRVLSKPSSFPSVNSPSLLSSPLAADFLGANEDFLRGCIDTGSGISLIDKQLLLSRFPTVQEHTNPFQLSIRIHGVGAKPIVSTTYVSLPIRFASLPSEAPIPCELHVVDCLSAGILIGMDVLRPLKSDISIGTTDTIHFRGLPNSPTFPLLAPTPETRARSSPHRIASCFRASPDSPKYVSNSSIARPSLTKAIPVRAMGTHIIPQGHEKVIPVHHSDISTPPSFRLYFEPLRRLSPSSFLSAARGVTFDEAISSIPLANLGSTDEKILPRTILGHVYLLSNIDCVSSLCTASLAAQTGHEESTPNLPFQLSSNDSQKHSPPQPNISPHWGDDYSQRVRSLLDNHSALFRPELGLVEGATMPIPFKDESDISGLKQSPYPMSPKDRHAMDSILDPLSEQGRVERVPLTSPSPASAPAFVVWRNGKPRVVVDLRRTNAKLLTDAYPLPRQDDILASLGKATIFSTLDITKSFFQVPIAAEDRWKTAFVSHRGHEQMTVSTMGLANSPAFFQHLMENILRRYLWKCLLVYIDDIIIFSDDKESHLADLDGALQQLKSAGFTLSLVKCHFAFPSLDLLGHKVSRLGLSTQKEKTEAISKLAFPETLQHLETGVGLFGYYRKFVDHFADIIDPLLKLKTRAFKNAPRKDPSQRKYANKTFRDLHIDSLAAAKIAWETIKERICSAPTLKSPDFSKPFLLYCDGSKERGLGVAIHQFDDEENERPVLFLSRTLSSAEEKFHSTELETAALVWALRKAPQYFDNGPFKVITDHDALKSALQTTPLNRRQSQRLNSWSLFLSSYHPRMEIVHRAGASHLNADALSRLPTVPLSDVMSQNTQISPRTAPMTPPPTLNAQAYPITVMELNEQMATQIREALPTDPSFRRIYHFIMRQMDENPDMENPHIYNHFRWDLDKRVLLMDGRLCIPASLEQIFFELAHDNDIHNGMERTCQRIRRAAYIPSLKRKVKTYIKHCPVCRIARPENHRDYGRLQPIQTPHAPFLALTIDFITDLPKSNNDYDTLMTVTDKFTKYVRFIPGRKTDGSVI